MPAPVPPGHRPALQARSQRTLDALLDAAAALLRERPYHELGVNEIISRAGSSTGSFYARFPDKSSVLHALHERRSEGAALLASALQRECAELAAKGATSSTVARHWITRLARAHAEQRGILRAVAIEAFQDERYRERAVTSMTKLAHSAVEALRPFRGTRSQRVFAAEVEFAVRLVFATLDQQLFLPLSEADAMAEQDAALVRRLTDVFTRYLQLV